MEFDSRTQQETFLFYITSSQTVAYTELHKHWVLAKLSQSEKRPKREADNSPRSKDTKNARTYRVEFLNMTTFLNVWYRCNFPLCLHHVVVSV